MNNDKSECFDYHFKCTSPEDYELTFYAKTSDDYLTRIFEKSQKALLRAKGIKVQGDPQLIKEFKIPSQYLYMVGLKMKKHLKPILEEIRDDGINVISHRIDLGKFKRDNNNNNWDISIVYKGEYLDERG